MSLPGLTDGSIVFITDNHSGGYEQGSGVLIAPDWVLTASHVVESWDVSGGPGETPEPVPATDIRVTPDNLVVGNPFQPNGPYGTFIGDKVYYNDVSTTPFGVQPMDYALIHLSTPVTGAPTMGLNADFQGGAVTFQGYPAIIDQQGHYVSSGPLVTVPDVLSSSDTGAINFDWFSGAHAPGSSGGPSWIQTSQGPEVVGLNSGIFGGSGIQTAITANAVNEIELWQAEGGESPAIYRLYQGVLDRAPDAAGWAGWSSLFVHDSIVPTEPLFGAIYQSAVQVLSENPNLVDGFLNSPEFTNAHASLSNQGLVSLLYENDLGRAPDAPGLAAWTQFLDTGALTREQLVIGISQSTEAQHHLFA